MPSHLSTLPQFSSFSAREDVVLLTGEWQLVLKHHPGEAVDIRGQPQEAAQNVHNLENSVAICVQYEVATSHLRGKLGVQLCHGLVSRLKSFIGKLPKDTSLSLLQRAVILCDKALYWPRSQTCLAICISLLYNFQWRKTIPWPWVLPNMVLGSFWSFMLASVPQFYGVLNGAEYITKVRLPLHNRIFLSSSKGSLNEY